MKKLYRALAALMCIAMLLAFAACFGSAGVLAGMLIGHHKTRKPLFTVTVPVLLLAQGAGLYLLFGH